MTEREQDDQLLDLGPDDLTGDFRQKLKAYQAAGVSEAEINRELRYLQIISARQVQLPEDAYFARTRQKISERVTIRPVSIWKTIRVVIWPETVRPIPALVTAGLLAVAILATLFYHSPIRTIETQVALGPYVPISETYTDTVVKMEEGRLSEQDLREYRQILVMSTAILGSPSSLSRSQALAGAGK